MQGPMKSLASWISWALLAAGVHAAPPKHGHRSAQRLKEGRGHLDIHQVLGQGFRSSATLSNGHARADTLDNLAAIERTLLALARQRTQQQNGENTVSNSSLQLISNQVKTMLEPEIEATYTQLQNDMSQLGTAVNLCVPPSPANATNATAELEAKKSLWVDCATQLVAHHDNLTECRQNTLAQVRDEYCKEANAMVTLYSESNMCVKAQDMDMYLAAKKLQFELDLDKYKELRRKCTELTLEDAGQGAACSVHNEQLQQQNETCRDLQKSFEEMVCGQRSALVSTCEAYRTCYNTSRNSYCSVRPAHGELDKKNRAAYQMMMKVLCLLDSLADDSPTEECMTKTFPEQYVVKYRKFPTRVQCGGELARLATMPCQAEFQEEHYSILSNNTNYTQYMRSCHLCV
jgi:hypothetical protein